MTKYAQHPTSGETFVLQYGDDNAIVALVGPLHYRDVTAANLEAGYDGLKDAGAQEDAEWANTVEWRLLEAEDLCEHSNQQERAELLYLEKGVLTNYCLDCGALLGYSDDSRGERPGIGDDNDRQLSGVQRNHRRRILVRSHMRLNGVPR